MISTTICQKTKDGRWTDPQGIDLLNQRISYFRTRSRLETLGVCVCVPACRHKRMLVTLVYKNKF